MDNQENLESNKLHGKDFSSEKYKVDRRFNANEFISILNGSNTDHIYVSSHNAEAERQKKRQLESEGKEYKSPAIRIPSPWYSHRPEIKYVNTPKDKWPSYFRPHYTIITEDIDYNYYKTFLGTKGNIPPFNTEISINHCKFSGKLNVNGLLTNCNVSFNDIYLNEFEQLGKNETPLTFFDCTIPTLNLTNISTEEILISNCNILNLFIHNIDNTINVLNIKHCTINNIFLHGKINAIEIINIKKTERIDVNAEFESFNINCKNLTEHNEKGEEVTIHRPLQDTDFTIKQFHIAFNNKTKGLIFIENINIINIKLTGINIGNIILRNIGIYGLSFDNLINTGEMKIIKLNDIKKLIINDSFLGKTELINIDLRGTLIDFIRSSISEIIQNDVKFPDNIYGVKKNDYKNIQEAYRQLKLSASKQGNRIREIEYESLEMDSYYKNKFDKKNWSDEIILFLNLISNNHGRYWPLALIGLLASTIILFILIKIELGFSFIIGLPNSKEVAEYLEFALNPVHDITKILSGYGFLPDRVKLYDVIAKLASGFYIFQFIRAFRKYVK